MLLPLWLACAADDTGDTALAWSYPLDEVLRVNDVQAVGTHKSYHQRTPGIEVPAWDYDHAPLDQQLGDQGVRQFELDVWYNADLADFDVYHVPVADQTSSCQRLSECLALMRAWSDAHPAHHPFLTLLELKDGFDDDGVMPLLATLDARVTAAWPEDRRISPDDVQRGYASVAEGLAEEGWPTLGETRGQAIFVLHTDADYRRAYTEGDTTTAGRAVFPDAHGDLSLAVGAVSSLNDPVGDAAAITAALAAGHLVRTRADSDGDEARAGDTTDRDAALAIGAHFVSTDFPVPYPDTGYVVEMPGGTPSRCNPVVAPAECTSRAIEDPAFIR
jgi:hypothetical protein